MSNPLLSVCLITYNHVDFIRDAIEGVLMQKVDFSWELIIADDFSTDGTREILIEYQKQHPEFIKLILQKKNVGAGLNWIDLIKSPISKYVAYFEGDDYWTDPKKLAKQVKILEDNPEYNACFHNATIIYSGTENSEKLVYPLKRKETITIEDLLQGDYLKSCSLVYRNHKNLLDPIINGSIPPDDTSLGYCLLQAGAKAKYLNESMAIYRIHKASTWSLLPYAEQNLWVLNDTKNRYKYYYTNLVMRKGIKNILLYNLKERVKIELKRYKFINAIIYVKEFINYKYFNFH